MAQPEVLIPEVLEHQRRVELAAELALNPQLAHESLFEKNHKHPSPAFHRELIDLYHSEHKHVVILTFRGSAKSTRLEEYATLLAVQGQAHNILIVGESYTRAVERLRSIKRELFANAQLIGLYGVEPGDAWSEGRIVLENGCAISAIGQGQALRGIKHHVYRPDVCLVDDLESMDTVATPEAREKLRDWFWQDLVPALDPDYRLRMTATPLNPEALAVKLAEHPAFTSYFVPIKYVDEHGETRSSWPSRWPLQAINELEETYKQAGEAHKFASEYMVQAVDPALQLFKPEHFRFEPLVRTWEPVFVSIDPARTVKETSATTGIVVASFTGRRLIFWEARAERLTPRDILDEVFRLEDRYHPVVIGIEKDGLEEFLMQPIREEELKRGQLLPIRPLKAPRGKDEFISRLQPLFAAGDVIFAGDRYTFKNAVDQFLSFPTGLKDVPNAAAYLFEMREGSPIYLDASYAHLTPNLFSRPSPYMLAINAGSYGTAAVLFQYHQKRLAIAKDFVSESAPGEALPSILEEARLFAGREVQPVAPPYHFDVRNAYGLQAALRGIAQLRKGGDPLKGRELLRELLRSEHQGLPRVEIGPEALWTRRALYGGFTWDKGRTKPKESLYEHIMVALEAALAPAAYQPSHQQRMATAPDGRRYATAEVRWIGS